MLSCWCLILLCSTGIFTIVPLNALKSLPEARCFLGPGMGKHLCDNVVVKHIQNVHSEPSLQADSVSEGTSCYTELTPGVVVSVECRAGKWVPADSKRKHLARIARRSTLSFSTLSDSGTQVIGYQSNPPAIYCPSIATPVYTDKGKTTARVSWESAVANSTEDGPLSVRQIQGKQSGVEHNGGDHVVSYIAWDKLGQAAFCSVSFTVVVRRCSYNFTYLLNGIAACTPDDHKYIYGSKCSYSCVPGYELTGNSSLECLSTGTWSGNKPYCRAISCGGPGKIEGGFLACETNQFTFTSKCEVVCNVGSVMGQSDFITCQANGQWTSAGKCQVNVCQQLEAVKDSRIICSQNNTFGSTCTFTCDNLNYTLQGEANRTCQDNQTWSGSQPECIRICPELPSVSYGSFECDSGKSLGNICTLKCDKGYHADGPLNITCDSNFQWTKSGSCSDIEPPVPEGGCPSNIKVTASRQGRPDYVFYSTPSFTDNSGESVNVVELPLSGSDFPLGSTTAFIIASDSAGNNFTCQFVITVTAKFCRNPHIALNSSDPIHFDCPNGFMYGATCNATCSNGSELQGMRLIKCNLNLNEEPEWSSAGDVMPYCQDQCSPGQWSSNGQQPCQSCQIGTYQAEYGSTKCEYCPYMMTTTVTGAVSKSDCRFIDIDVYPLAKPIIQLNDVQPKSFTVMTWMHLESQSPKMTLYITIDPEEAKQGSAYLSLDDFAVYVIPLENLTAKSIRYWYHLALVFDTQEGFAVGTLYLNGDVLYRIPGLSPSLLSFKSFDLGFVGTVFFFLNNRIKLTGFQMTRAALTQDQVRQFVSSCMKMVDENILVSPQIQNGSLSICDSIDNCKGNPCGPNGTCIDGDDTFTCICNEPWSGRLCQIPPNFCSNHACANGASCINNIQYLNFTCVCADKYKGSLCQDQIVNGGWGTWKEWSSCSKDCQRSRTRLCDSPRPDSTGKGCLGDNEQQQKCFGDQCPVGGGFGEWSDWSPCSVTCGGGEMFKRRTCDNPAPSNGGASCDGLYVSSVQCNTEKCPECPTLEKRSGHQSLEYTKNMDKSLTSCQIICKPGMTTTPEILNKFQCGYLTNYSWTHQTDKNPTGILPDCGEMTLPIKTSLIVKYDYENVTCSSVQSPNFTQSLEQKILLELNCSNQNSCDYEISVISDCDGQSSMSGLIRAEVSYRVNTSIDWEGVSVQNLSQRIDRVFTLIVDTYIAELVTHGTVETSYTAQLILQCPNGTGYSGSVCVACPPGSYSPGNSSCKLCEKGYYQDQARRTSCIKCPVCRSTEGEGSYLLDHCKEDCSTETSTSASPTDETTNIPLIIGLASGSTVVVLILAAVLVICFMKSIRKHRHPHPYNIPGEVNDENPYASANREDIYDEIEDSPYISAESFSAGSLAVDSAGYIRPGDGYKKSNYTELVNNDPEYSSISHGQLEDAGKINMARKEDSTLIDNADKDSTLIDNADKRLPAQEELHDGIYGIFKSEINTEKDENNSDAPEKIGGKQSQLCSESAGTDDDDDDDNISKDEDKHVEASDLDSSDIQNTSDIKSHQARPESQSVVQSDYDATSDPAVSPIRDLGSVHENINKRNQHKNSGLAGMTSSDAQEIMSDKSYNDTDVSFDWMTKEPSQSFYTDDIIKKPPKPHRSVQRPRQIIK